MTIFQKNELLKKINFLENWVEKRTRIKAPHFIQVIIAFATKEDMFGVIFN